MRRQRRKGMMSLIVDTAGSLHVDEELMRELEEMKTFLEPREVFFVANATTGQDAVKTAAEFDKRVQITGTILTMLDGNARAGAAISIREVTKKPLKFEGVGEKIGDLQSFQSPLDGRPDSRHGRCDQPGEESPGKFRRRAERELEKKLKKATFTYEDYLKQMGMVKKMGSFKSLLKMLPGFGSMGDFDFSDTEFNKMEAIILLDDSR